MIHEHIERGTGTYDAQRPLWFPCKNKGEFLAWQRRLEKACGATVTHLDELDCGLELGVILDNRRAARVQVRSANSGEPDMPDWEQKLVEKLNA